MGTELMPGVVDTDGRFDAAADHLIPWIEQVAPLAGKTVLEYGCGTGFVSRAFAGRAERHIGFDIDAEAVAMGREVLAYGGLANAELHHVPEAGITAAVEALAGEVDVFLLYAVLEHMSVDERLDVLHLARRVVRRDGMIVVCEAPNRLVDFDHHTARMPFFSQLPEELALRYARRSRREEFTASMATAARGGPDTERNALTRWGRGISFHEFELVFGDLRRHVIASNYDPLLMDVRPVQPDEHRLGRGLEETRPDLAPVFGRYWLDLVLSPVAVAAVPSYIRPWPLSTRGSDRVAFNPGEWLEVGRGGRLRVELRAPTRELMIGVVADAEVAEVWVRGRGAAVGAVAVGEVGEPRFVMVDLAAPEREVDLRFDQAVWVNFVGYRG
ncbi:MAG: class I SAM-dependent methyltransferase [Solirubrobacteraceae bacterium]